MGALNSVNLSAQVQSVASGNWDNPAIWDCVCVPDTGNVVIIAPAHNVSVNTATDFAIYSSVTVEGSLNLNAAQNLDGVFVVNGVLNGYAALVFQSTINLTGSGVYHNAGGLYIPFPYVFTVATISNANGLNAGAQLTYAAGVTVNNISALTGVEHIISSGAVFNTGESYFGENTVIRNFGTFNWQSGDITGGGCSESTTPMVYNEAGGVMNINTPDAREWRTTRVTNHGTINKSASNITTFSNTPVYCYGPGGWFINSSSGELNIQAGQTIKFQSSACTLNGIVNIAGVCTIGTTCTIGGALNLSGDLNLNAGTTFVSGMSLSGVGVLNNAAILYIPFAYTFSLPTINNNHTIYGVDSTIYASGVILNNSGSLIGSTVHKLTQGSTLNAGESYFGENTVIRNFGTFNWQSGDITGGGCSSTTTPMFINDSTGSIYINTPDNRNWRTTRITNYGMVIKSQGSTATFSNQPVYCYGPEGYFNNTDSGVLSGVGVMNFAQSFSHTGVIAPGLSPGELTINSGSVTNGILEVEINSAAGPGIGHDKLIVNGNFTAAGTLNLTLDLGYTPNGDPTFEIVSTSGTVNGEFSTINYPPGDWYIQYNSGSIVVGAGSLTPDCSSLIYPINGDLSVSPDAMLSWSPVMNADGYSLSIGSIPGGTDIANDLDVGNVTSYDPPGPLPFETVIYVTIVPYNGDGPAEGCLEESFTVAPQCPAGDVTLLSQLAVNNFGTYYPYCESISGHLQIGNWGGSDINSLIPLTGLEQISGNLSVIENSVLTTLSGLNQIQSIGGNLYCFFNPVLTSLNGLDGLTTLGAALDIWSNASLTSIGMPLLTSIGGYMWIDNDYALVDLSGLDAVTQVSGFLNITTCNSLASLTGLSGLAQVGGSLSVTNNPALAHFTGLNSLGSVMGSMTITGNSALQDFQGLNQLTQVGGEVFVKNNSALVSFNGLSSLQTIGTNLWVENNHALINFNGFSALQTIGGSMEVWGNNALVDFDGLESLSSVGANVKLNFNPLLINCNGLQGLTTIGGLFEVWSNSSLVNFYGLENLSAVNGKLNFLVNNALTSLSGLNSLQTIGGEMAIWYCPVLTSMSGLESLTTVGQNVFIQTNDALLNLNGLGALTSVGTEFAVSFCPMLQNLSGLNALTTIGEDLRVTSNNVLTSIEGLSSVTSINGVIAISWNPMLTSLSGIENIDPNSITHLELVNSGQLSICGLPNICEYVSNPANTADISGNASGCATRPNLVFNCTDSDNDGYGIALDCNDNNASVYPGATEICNGIDDNCDGNIDEGLTDTDNDGVCDAIDNCPDTSNPGQDDLDNDGIGDACDNCILYSNADQADFDNDNVGDVCDPDDDNDTSLDNVDCAPFDASIFPGATEVCGDLVDNDCDGLIDEDLNHIVVQQNLMICSGTTDGYVEVTGDCGLPPYDYYWNTGATSALISNLGTGTYKVTITDDQGLIKKATFVITAYPTVNLSVAKQNVSCNGSSNGSATANPSGGQSPFTYEWNTGASTKSISSLTPGTYTVTVTDANGCTKSKSVTITEPTAVEITSIDVQIDPGNPGKYKLTVHATGGTPGYKYRKCNATGSSCQAWQNSNVFTNIPPGTHTMRVKDSYGCLTEQSITLSNGSMQVYRPDDRPADVTNELPEVTFVQESTYVESSITILPMDVSPNPGRSFAQIGWTATDDGEAHIIAHNLSGQEVLHHKVSQVKGWQQFLLDTHVLESGAYVITVIQTNGRESKLWIKVQ
jgi:hypothetical protein